MISSFSQYLVEEQKTVYFTFGRMNPPTIGHGKLMDTLAAKSGNNPYRVYLSQSHDSKKNPLEYNSKVKHLRKMFPKHARQIMINKKVRTAIEAAVALYDEGFKRLVMVVGDDRVREFDVLLKKYNGQNARHGFYNFERIQVISAGARDPDAEGAEGASATKQRQAATDNDFTTFAQGLPKAVSNNNAKRLFNDVRKGMGLKEEREFKRHVQLESISETREKFVSGSLFNIGEQVIVKKTDQVGVVSIIGANYIIVETNDGKTRQWLDAVEKIEEGSSMYADKPDWGTPESTAKAKKRTPGQNEASAPQDPDIKDREGTQPKRYHSGLSKATKIARDRHFKKGAAMDDNNPDAYKPAPGDANAKTKPSKHTTFVKKMMGERSMDVVRDRISTEKQKQREKNRKEKDDLKRKHDRMLDRTRRAKMLQVNKGIDEAVVTEDSFADKAKSSGISATTLKKVYNRGVAAWRTGHRPGTNPSQWGHARVNAFIAKKKKGTLNHDKDLA